MERLPEELNNQIFKKLKSIVEIERMSVNERLEYELSMAAERDMLCALDAKYEDGLEEGEVKGIKKGREEGIKEGLEKGREEGIQKGREEIATNLKSLGMSSTDISKATGLTIDEIEQL